MNNFRARAVISTEALVRNLDLVHGIAGVDVMAVVKADAYGHGVAELAPLLRDHGITWLGVALPSEALALRANGDTGKILAWLTTPGDPDIARCVAANVDLSVSSVRELTDIVAAAEKTHTLAQIHIKIDTGLSRNGVQLENLDDVLALAKAATTSGRVNVRGVWSHLANADHVDPAIAEQSVAEQIAVFESALGAISGAGITPEVRHLAQTAGALWHPAARYDLVRIGIGMYGLSPNADRISAHELGLVPAMHVQARLSQVKDIAPGTGVSYGHTWKAKSPTSIGLVPIGYADGLPRNLSNSIEFAIGGSKAAQIGTIAMDQCVVDLESIEGVKPGDLVSIFGPGASGELTADELASRMGTIGYEIVTRLGVRVPRDYQ